MKDATGPTEASRNRPLMQQHQLVRVEAGTRLQKNTGAKPALSTPRRVSSTPTGSKRLGAWLSRVVPEH